MGPLVLLLRGQNLPQNLSLFCSPFVIHAAPCLSPSFLCQSSRSSGEEPLPLDVGSAFDLLPRRLERPVVLRGDRHPAGLSPESLCGLTRTPAPVTDSNCPVSGSVALGTDSSCPPRPHHLPTGTHSHTAPRARHGPCWASWLQRALQLMLSCRYLPNSHFP